jgi:O-antigen ligase
VIHGWVKIENFLNYVLLFLLPTQLALHFWPPFAFVFGTRIDYLSPSIYLTDILFLLLFLFWFRKNRKKFFSFLKKNRVYVLLFIALAILNIIVSISVYASIYKWLKLVELALFCFYVWARDDIFKSKTVLTVFFYSLIFFSVVGIIQFILGKTIGGPLYLLGERNFNISTSGIALVQLSGVNFMRAYSTFSHPNSFAGYLCVGLLIILFAYSKKELMKKSLGILIICLAFVLTFSSAAFLGLFVCFVVYIFWRKKVISLKNIILLPALFLVASLLLPFVSGVYFKSNISLAQDIGQRFELALGAGRVISQKFFLGEGLNTFIIGESKITQLGFYLWILQPVHNIFLLIFSETGVFGLLIAYYVLVKLFKKTLLLANSAIFLCLVFILTTGLFDHYWFTLQQNMFLFAYIVGNSFRVRT